VERVLAGSLNIDGGRLSIRGASVLNTVSVAAGATLDLNQAALIVDHGPTSPLADLTPLLIRGRAGGTWTGDGVTSSAATVDPTRTSLGIAAATDLFASFPANFAGVSVDADSVIVAFTTAGDANLDFRTDIADFSRLAANFNAPGAWPRGDFDYSGGVGIGDFAILAANFNQSLPADASMRTVPEPAVAATALLAAITAFRRRRGGC
jgi:hypothetical protein